ncbi:fatty acid synthase-like [Bemisia tabaci]|uniref:fatty acid synthase-like n=1 Tax=Bemisia tabaci TaxID=7038 RepID=UPI003B27DB79
MTSVEFVPTQLSTKHDSKVAASITYISDPKELTHLPNGEDVDNSYLFVAVPSKIQIKSIVDTASKFKRKYAVIYEQQFNSHNYGLLKKNKSGQKWKVCHVSKSVLSTLDDLNSDGRTVNEGFVLVVPKSQFVNPTVMMPKILKKARKIKIRCFFLLDDDASPFSLDKKFYREQFEKNVVVNVLKNGKWGSFRGTPLRRPAPTDVAQILPHVNQVSEEVNIRYIGLNPASTKRRTKGTPAVLDYSGTTSSGGHVMGIAHKNEGFEGKILLDPVFQWTLPDSFPLAEAASLPSAYLMAHLIMKEILIVNTEHKVFILNGQTPVSMALISLCLGRNFEVYTTVPNEAARQLVSLMFPQIPKSNITNHNSEDFYVPVMFGTKGCGADVVVCDLPYKQMLSAWKCSGRYGCFINLNEETTDHNAPLPMGMFRFSNGYYFYPLSKLAKLPEEVKIQLHTLVKESLSSGRMVHMPHQSMSIKEIGELNRFDNIFIFMHVLTLFFNWSVPH